MNKYKRYRMRHPERVRETQRRYRNAHRSERNEYSRIWRQANKLHCQAYMVAWRNKQPPGYWHKWPSRPERKPRKPGRTREERNAVMRERHSRAARLVTDVYLRGWLSRTVGGQIKPNEWPAALVELKRALIQIKRYINYGNTEKHRRTASANA